MDVATQIKDYIESQVDQKRSDMLVLHQHVMQLMPGCKLWFLNGKNDENKTIANPNIGYGIQNIHYANGNTKQFYQIGMSANTTGISIYIMGIEDKKYLSQTFASKIGKASISGYCIKFKKLSDIHLEVLTAAIQHGILQK